MAEARERENVAGRGPLNPTTIYVTEAPKFDLDAYISNYEARTRLDRLRTIGVCSKTLGVEALRKGLIEASKGQDADVFRDFHSLYKAVSPHDDSLQLNESSAIRIDQVTQRETERLENDLKGYKNNLIKESIRLGNDDLGQHYYNAGKLPEAFRAFSSMREFCTVPKHAAEMSLKLILTAAAQRQWMTVQSNVFKLQNLSLKPEDKAKVDPMLWPISGLGHMASGAYKDAASCFLRTDPAYATVEAVAGVKPSTQILTANDVAVYGGLCALASLPREQLSSRVLENADFRSFLELESHLRRAIVCFCNAKYTQCLEILESYRADYLLDVHLQRHVEPLYAAIRRKSIIAYCAPFDRVSIAAMGSAFGVNERRMEQELYEIIKKGDLNARLDVVDMLLVAKDEDKRAAAYTRALEMAQEHEKALQLRLFRINMLQHGFDIRPPRKEGGEAAGSHKTRR